MGLLPAAVVLALAVSGCVSVADPDQAAAGPAAQAAPAVSAGEPAAGPRPARMEGPAGSLVVDVGTVHGDPVACHLELVPFEEAPPLRFELPEGEAALAVPAGSYRAYVYVYEYGLAIMAHLQDITVPPGPDGEAYILVSLVEGVGGTRPLRDFDSDGDLVIDRVELEAGTDPNNALSVPGAAPLPFSSPVLSSGAGWYRGELHAQSAHGEGTESVAALVQRAEKAGLDFLAIADTNTLAAVDDPGFRSSRVVLIPAVKWGSDEMGYALLYGPRTRPLPPANRAFMQGLCFRTQAQGGVFAAAHPCLPTAPWQWNTSYINAAQVWYRDWRDIPPVALERLREDLLARAENGRLIYSIAEAAAASSQSANSQAAEFWQYELARGAKLCAIAGSGSGSPRVPIGRPVTYVYATEKSVAGILEGMRLGRTYVSSGLDGPQIGFTADVGDNGKIDINIGGTFPIMAVPAGKPTILQILVSGARGKKMQLLENGRVYLSKIIESDPFFFRLPQAPRSPTAFQVRVVGPATRPGFGPVEVHALTSPIYADDIISDLFWQDPNRYMDESNWVRVEDLAGPLEEVQLPDIPPLQPGFVAR